MDLLDIGKKIAALGLPLLGAALPIPGGAALGTALAHAIGGDSGKPEDLLATLSQSAEALQKAREFEATHAERMLDLVQQHELATYQAEIADRESARARDIALQQAGQKNRRADWMILGDVVGLLACLTAMVYVTWLGVRGVTPDADVSPLIMALNGPLGMLTQQFANGLRDAHQFEFGSSRGSKDKDSLLLNAQPPAKA